MSFRGDDLRIRGVDPRTVSSTEAWWHIKVVGGEHAPGCLQVLDEARRTAGLAGGLTGDDARFRQVIACALNRMLDDVGPGLIESLRGADVLRLSRLKI